MSWLSDLFKHKPHMCAYRESDVYLADDPKCVYCGKHVSELYKEEGKPFVKKSIIKRYEEMFDNMNKLKD